MTIPLYGQMMDVPLTVSSLLAHASRHFGTTEIVSRRIEGDMHRYTYRDCEKRAKQLAQALVALGVEAGDRVGTLAWNGYRHLETYYGTTGFGAVCHPINPRLFPDQIVYIVNHADDRYVLFDITFAPLIDTLAPQCPNVRGWIALTHEAHMPRMTTAVSNYEALIAQHDGWLPTGDVAMIDHDGFMHITDRSKDLIKSGSEWISSIDIENVAVAHPAVAEAACIACAHSSWTERPLLLVVKHPNSNVSREELLRLYEGKVAKWWIPDDVVFVDELPHTATGKLNKLKLREQYRDHILPSQREG